jgi:carbonic anhydrase
MPGLGDNGYEPTPQNAIVLQDLIDGNNRFLQGTLEKCKADPELVKKLSGGQAPKAIVLACSDSRSPPELIFDQGLGDLFIVRVAGNIVSPNALGSILYAISHLGSKLVVVLGHSKCGAVAATVDAYKGGHKGHADAEDPISSLVAAIHPVVHHCHTKGPEKEDAEFKGEVAKQNSVHAAKEVAKCLGKRLPSELKPEVSVVASIYNIEDGKVDILEALPVQ